MAQQVQLKWILVPLGALALVGVGVAGALLITGGNDGPEPVPVAEEPALEAEPVDEPEEDFSFTPGDEEEDCDSLGINPEELQEGTCLSEGQRVRVVNRDSSLRLPEMNVRLAGIDLTESVSGDFDSASASGQFVVLRLEVRNKTTAPVDFDIDQVGLSLDENIYTSDWEGTEVLDDNLIYETIQPQATLTGTVVFDIPRRMAGELDESGNVSIAQFSDAQYGDVAGLLGIIRTYH
jgi:hypothetical protein